MPHCSMNWHCFPCCYGFLNNLKSLFVIALMVPHQERENCFFFPLYRVKLNKLSNTLYSSKAVFLINPPPPPPHHLGTRRQVDPLPSLTFLEPESSLTLYTLPHLGIRKQFDLFPSLTVLEQESSSTLYLPSPSWNKKAV